MAMGSTDEVRGAGLYKASRAAGRYLVYDEDARTAVAYGFDNREAARVEKRRLDPTGTRRLVISRDVLHRLGRSRGR